jgi:hypothetical protein
MRVRVYRNLTKNCWSVQYKTKKGWRLYTHTKGNFILENVKFIISKSGQDRVRKEKKKYVHAYIEGDYNLLSHRIANKFDAVNYSRNHWITYNPYENDTFMVNYLIDRIMYSMPVNYRTLVNSVWFDRITEKIYLASVYSPNFSSIPGFRYGRSLGAV